MLLKLRISKEFDNKTRNRMPDKEMVAKCKRKLYFARLSHKFIYDIRDWMKLGLI